MDKEQLNNNDINKDAESVEDQNQQELNEKDSKEKEKISPEEEIESLKDKIARTYAEMENQRRRYEKEKDDAFEYGGFAFAKETLNLLDNLERSKVSLENDNTLKNTDVLKKVLEHFEVFRKS